jgi:hypothetical protein
MATRKLSGGGIQSNKLKRVPVKAGPPSTNKMSPAAAAQLGAHLGDHVTERGKVLSNPADRLLTGTAPQVRSGNDVAQSTKAGPGGSRNIYPAGTQAKTPAAAGLPRGREILGQFGAERRRG